MDDIEFCKEYVKRIVRPFKTKVDQDLVNIVENNITIEKNKMFSDIEINKLYPNSVNAWIYSYVRDNQNLFLKPKMKIK